MLLRALGYLWALPHTLLGALLLLTWYLPKTLRWRDGALEVVVRRRYLIGGKWVGGQTWGWIIFFRDVDQQKRRGLQHHERVHVKQALIGGPYYAFAWLFWFVTNWATNGFNVRKAYYDIPFEEWARGEYEYTRTR